MATAAAALALAALLGLSACIIPRGFAHGILVLSETAELCYKCDDVYFPDDEGGLMWNDPAIGIEWPAVRCEDGFSTMSPVLSEKDRYHPRFEEQFARKLG